MKIVLVHYSEIGTKKDNRGYFERKLAENIHNTLDAKVERQRGRILVRGAKKLDALKFLPGVHSYSVVEEIEPKFEKIKAAAVALAKKSKAKTFRITAQRSDKNFPHTSMELNKQVGAEVWKKTKKKVDLHNPELEIFIEVAQKAYVYSQKEKGPDGLPVGSAGKVVCLLSGGIDSPVAAYRMMTRGCKIIFVHFHNYDPFIAKIKDLVSVLSKYQGRSTAYLVPFKEVQQEIIKKIDPKYRMILYRRLMMKISEEIMHKENAKGIVTGDSLAQVASQTLENIHAIYDAIDAPIFSPLIGRGKIDIIDEAKKIDTYGTSIKPYTDCCSVLIAKHPATKSDTTEIRKLEKKLKISALVKDAIKRAEVVKI